MILPAIAGLVTILASLSATAEKLPSFEEALASSDIHELTAWGSRYARGVGVPQDTKKAVQLYCKAARKGDVEAKFQLGQVYAFGQGVTRDRDIAAAWYYQAAQGENRKAATMLKVLKVAGKPKGKASCPLDTGTRLASRRHPASGEIARMVRDMAPRYQLDPNLVLAVVEAESGFNPKALSPKNAQGLMQLIPATAQRFGVADVWDPGAESARRHGLLALAARLLPGRRQAGAGRLQRRRKGRGPPRRRAALPGDPGLRETHHAQAGHRGRGRPRIQLTSLTRGLIAPPRRLLEKPTGLL